MNDDFGLSSGDEAELLAATADVVNGKRSHHDDDPDKQSFVKRAKGNQIDKSPSPSTLLANNILKARFGLDGFRLEQEAAITRILDGGSAVVVFPTGGGKSLCYQVSHSAELNTAFSNQNRSQRCVFDTRMRRLAADFPRVRVLASSYRLSSHL
jgi:superfamily II DNA/RNA helicase